MILARVDCGRREPLQVNVHLPQEVTHGTFRTKTRICPPTGHERRKCLSSLACSPWELGLALGSASVQWVPPGVFPPLCWFGDGVVRSQLLKAGGEERAFDLCQVVSDTYAMWPWVFILNARAVSGHPSVGGIGPTLRHNSQGAHHSQVM